MQEEREVLAIFPLPNVVVFPGIAVPLHVFEPRYLAMMADVLRGEGTLGIVALKPGWEENYEGNPETYEIGCKGVVVQYEEVPAHGLNIMVQGIQRFRILREIPGKPYRRAEVALLPEQLPGEAEGGGRLVQHLIDRIGDLQGRSLPIDWNLLKKLMELDEVVFINAISYLSPFDTSCKQFLLEAKGISDRYEKYIQLAEFDMLNKQSHAGRSSSQGTEWVH